jgi:hypothetical protein
MVFLSCFTSASREENLLALKEMREGVRLNVLEVKGIKAEAEACLKAVHCLGQELAKKGPGINVIHSVGSSLHQQRSNLVSHIQSLEGVVDEVLSSEEQLSFLSSDYKKLSVLREASLSGKESVAMGVLQLSHNKEVIKIIQASHGQIIREAQDTLVSLSQVLNEWENKGADSASS